MGNIHGHRYSDATKPKQLLLGKTISEYMQFVKSAHKIRKNHRLTIGDMGAGMGEVEGLNGSTLTMADELYKAGIPATLYAIEHNVHNFEQLKKYVAAWDRKDGSCVDIIPIKGDNGHSLKAVAGGILPTEPGLIYMDYTCLLPFEDMKAVTKVAPSARLLVTCSVSTWNRVTSIKKHPYHGKSMESMLKRLNRDWYVNFYAAGSENKKVNVHNWCMLMGVPKGEDCRAVLFDLGFRPLQRSLMDMAKEEREANKPEPKRKAKAKPKTKRTLITAVSDAGKKRRGRPPRSKPFLSPIQDWISTLKEPSKTHFVKFVLSSRAKDLDALSDILKEQE